MADIKEHHKRIQDAINAAESDGFTIEAKTCCCGEGLRIFSGVYWEPIEAMEFEV